LAGLPPLSAALPALRSMGWLLPVPAIFCSRQSIQLPQSSAGFDKLQQVLVPHKGTAAAAGEVALRTVEAGVDAVGIHLQSDARRANPRLIENDYLGDVARAVF
jgi:hypothetical protein